MRKLNNDSFIKKSIIVHGLKYNYDKIDYSGSHDKLIIICPIHGEFVQTASEHITGYGCIKCSGKYKYTNAEFIEKSILIHGNKYNYDKVNYINTNTKVIINCLIHGDFEQTPTNHMSGQGCKKCKISSMTSNITDFINKSILIHGNKYNYDKVNYNNYLSKINIICVEHGVFKQTPHGHINGRGCPKCCISKGENIIEEYLIQNNIKYKPQYYFDNLIYKRHLRFDYAILDNFDKLKYLIEYNGEQHYRYIEYLHKTEDNFLESIKRDELKINYCIKNNIKLYIIKYNENIKEKLCQMK